MQSLGSVSNMKKKKRGKYRYIRLTKLEKEEAAKLAWQLIIKEMKKHMGII